MTAAIRGQRGFVTLEHIAVAAFGLVLFTWCANIILLQYARAVTRLAVDEGVRAAVAAGGPPAAGACQDAAGQAMGDLLAGSMGDAIFITCSVEADRVRATGVGTVPNWLPTMDVWSISVSAEAPRPDVP